MKTGIAIACPTGTYGRVAPRSGLAVKKFIDTGAGVIDADYRGEVGVVLFNFSDQDFSVKVGDRIAQLVLEKICMVPAIEVETLSDTERGSGGFGSTGVSSDVQVGDKRQISWDSEDQRSPIAELLALIESLPNSVSAQSRTSLKELALKSDERFVAASETFKKSNNKESLVETLMLIISLSKNER